MSKIIAREVDPELFNSLDFYTEDDAEEDLFWAGGNRDFRDFNEGLVKNIKQKLQNAYYDIYLVDDATEQDIDDAIKYYFKREHSFSIEEKQRLLELVKLFDEANSLDIICEVLSILHERPFKHGDIRGYSQGDWMEYVCPESMSDEQIDFIEAVLMGTGIFFQVCKLEDDEEWNDGVDDESFELTYTHYYHAEDIKRWLSNLYNVDENKIKVQKIKSVHTHYTYDYEDL